MAKKKKVKKARLSQAQQDQRTAAQLVKQQLAPTVAEIERQRKIAAADAAKRASFITAMTQTASEAAGQFAPKVQAAYNTAATDQTAFGKGYSDAFKQAQGANAEQTNKLLTQSGATEGQMASGDTGAADALYGIAGAIPGSALSTEGAAFTSAAAKLPTTVGLMGQQYLSAAQGQDKKTMDDILNQLTQVQLKRPGLINEVVSQLQTNRSKSQQQAFENQLASQTLGLNTYKAETNAAYQQGTLKLKAASLKVAAQKVAAGDRQKINTAVSKMMGYLADSYGTPITGKNGKVVSIGSPSSLDQKSRTDIAETVFEGFNGVKDKSGNWVSPPHKSYLEVYRDLMAEYPSASKEIVSVLNTYYGKPGKMGRPWTKKELQKLSNQNLASIYNKMQPGTMVEGTQGPQDATTEGTWFEQGSSKKYKYVKSASRSKMIQAILAKYGNW